jgi:hypothetical protein
MRWDTWLGAAGEVADAWRTKRVEPGVQLDASAVRGGDPCTERVVVVRREPFAAADELARRLEPRVVERIGRGAHLQHQCVEAERLGPRNDGVDLGALFRPTLGAACAWPVDVGHRRDPGRAQLARRRRRQFVGAERRGLGRACGTAGHHRRSGGEHAATIASGHGAGGTSTCRMAAVSASGRPR